MGSAPLTIFFMACLMCFFEVARTHSCFVSVDWPKRCANKTYCQEKPENYPTTSEFKAMQENSKFDFSEVVEQPPADRDGVNICRETNEKGFVYMIKDTNNAIRYVVQDPEVFQLGTVFKECKKQVQLLPRLSCQESFTKIRLPVTTCDGTGIELYEVSTPTSCAPMMVSDYEIMTNA